MSAFENKTVAIGADHAGFTLKEALRQYLTDAGYQVTDVGTQSAETSVDYPDIGNHVARLVDGGDCRWGVLCCGSGIGMAIAANRLPGVRALVCTNETEATLSRQHNDANVICFGERITPKDTALALLKMFLATEFEGERHQARIDKLSRLSTEVHATC